MNVAWFALSPWGWFVLGGILLVLEIFIPGASLVWLGIAGFITGLIGFAITLPWQAQIFIFAVLAVLAVIVGRRLSPAQGEASDRPFLNRRADALAGRILFLEIPIHGGVGAVRVDDTLWRVEGPDLPAGERVKVVRAEGAVLIVEPADQGTPTA
ncbi:NfeD family protein [Aquabacter sp. CN5-332]|uniref:NfeD family protein n=1 Tax=Aquabacter sp. CN5-332 TaxID=3156608 RepID=UPI0032B54790